MRADSEVSGQAGEPGQGPWLAVHLRLANGRVTEARYETYACPNAHRCGAWICHWVVGRTPSQTAVLTADDLRRVLAATPAGALPLGKEHCADLAVRALAAAATTIAT